MGSLHIQRSKACENDWKPQPLKTANADRVIPLVAWLCDELRDYLTKVHQDSHNPKAPLFPARLSRQHGKALGRNVTNPMDCFDWARPIDQQNLYKCYWLPALKALGFPHMVARDMRHMCAIESLRGDHYRDVSRWLGHAKISTKLDIYAANITGEGRGKECSTPPSGCRY